MALLCPPPSALAAEGACSRACSEREREIYHVMLQVRREVSFQNEAFKAFKTLMKQGKNSAAANGFRKRQENKGKQKNPLCFSLTFAKGSVPGSLISPHLKTTELFFWSWEAEIVTTQSITKLTALRLPPFPSCHSHLSRSWGVKFSVLAPFPLEPSHFTHLNLAQLMLSVPAGHFESQTSPEIGEAIPQNNRGKCKC